jgi:hypothetical protein
MDLQHCLHWLHAVAPTHQLTEAVVGGGESRSPRNSAEQ